AHCERARAALSPSGRGICWPLDHKRMKERSMPRFSVSKSGPDSVKCDVLVVPVYEQLALGPGAREVEKALGTTLKALSEHTPVLGKPSKQFTGELGDAVLVQ